MRSRRWNIMRQYSCLRLDKASLNISEIIVILFVFETLISTTRHSPRVSNCRFAHKKYPRMLIQGTKHVSLWPEYSHFFTKMSIFLYFFLVFSLSFRNFCFFANFSRYFCSPNFSAQIFEWFPPTFCNSVKLFKNIQVRLSLP